MTRCNQNEHERRRAHRRVRCLIVSESHARVFVRIDRHVHACLFNRLCLTVQLFRCVSIVDYWTENTRCHMRWRRTCPWGNVRLSLSHSMTSHRISQRITTRRCEQESVVTNALQWTRANARLDCFNSMCSHVHCVAVNVGRRSNERMPCEYYSCWSRCRFVDESNRANRRWLTRAECERAWLCSTTCSHREEQRATFDGRLFRQRHAVVQRSFGRQRRCRWA
jgi:hypothetical protein